MLFINFSRHFEKGTHKSRLLDVQIRKIAATHEFRHEEQQHSLRVPLERAADTEDCSLNITVACMHVTRRRAH